MFPAQLTRTPKRAIGRSEVSLVTFSRSLKFATGMQVMMPGTKRSPTVDDAFVPSHTESD